jgi:glycosyltransferase involved in cell wall biosynthesis
VAQMLRQAPPVEVRRAREYAGGVARAERGRARVEPLRTHRPLHVLHVFQPETGGVPAYVAALSAGLLEAGVRVSVAGPSGAEAFEDLRALGAEILPLRLARPPDPVLDALAIRALARWSDRRRVTVMHGHSTKAGMLAAFAAWRAGVPSLYTPHCWSFDQQVGLPLRAAYAVLERQLVRRFHSGVICVSAAEGASAARWRVAASGRVAVVPTGVASGSGVSRASARRALGLPADEVVAVWVGRVGAQKRPEDLATLMRWLRGQVRVLALCHGVHGTSVEAQLRAAGVHLAAAGTDAGLAYAAADLMIQTSAWEAAPLAILEAMAAGLPVVAYDVGGLSEQVRSGRTGYLVAPGDLAMLSDCVVALARRPAVRRQMGEAGRRHGEERFSYEAMVRGMIDAYMTCRTGRGSVPATLSARMLARA